MEKKKGVQWDDLYCLKYTIMRIKIQNNKVSNLFKNYNLKKEIDVLFFGRINPDRKVLLNFITNSGISIKIVGQDNNFVTESQIII